MENKKQFLKLKNINIDFIETKKDGTKMYYKIGNQYDFSSENIDIDYAMKQLTMFLEFKKFFLSLNNKDIFKEDILELASNYS